jgi:hypothetical protein
MEEEMKNMFTLLIAGLFSFNCFAGELLKKIKPKNVETITSYIKRPVTMADGEINADVVVGFKTNTGRTVMVTYEDMKMVFSTLWEISMSIHKRDDYKLREHADVTGSEGSSKGVKYNNVPLNKPADLWPDAYFRWTNLYSHFTATIIDYDRQEAFFGSIKAGTPPQGTEPAQDHTFFLGFSRDGGQDLYVIDNLDVTDFFHKYWALEELIDDAIIRASFYHKNLMPSLRKDFPLNVPIYHETKPSRWMLKSTIIKGNFVQLNKEKAYNWKIIDASSSGFPEGLGLIYRAEVYGENSNREIGLLTIGGNSVLLNSIPYVDYGHPAMEMPKVAGHPSLPVFLDSGFVSPGDHKARKKHKDKFVIQPINEGSQALAVDDEITLSMAEAERGRSFYIHPLKNDIGEGIRIVKASSTKNGKVRLGKKGSKIRYTLKKKKKKMNYRGTEMLSYTIKDKEGNTSTATIKLTITD